MSDHQSFQRFTAMTAIMSFLFAVASIVLQGIPINFSPDIADNPALWLVVGADGASLFRRGMILDLLGMILSGEALALPAVASYVLLAPIWAVWLGINLVRKPVQIA